MNAELNHVINSVKKAPVYSTPYNYCYITNFFTESFYKEILNYLPTVDNRYTECEYPYNREKGLRSNRYMLLMEECNNEVIQEAVEILKSEELKDTYFTKFKKNKIPVWCKPTLYRDKTGYYIPPHKDVKSKAITTQIYLPENNNRENIGTIINIKEGKKQFKKYKQLKFCRNTGYALVPSENSWHSVDTLTEDNFDRNTIMFTYYKSKIK